jgi:multiple sugar transport system permease protein
MAISEARKRMLVDVHTAEPLGRRWRRALGPDLDGYGFILPAAIIMTALVVYPFCLAIWFSLSDGMIGETRHWIGLQNFVYILQDHIFLQTIRNTIVFAVSSVVLKSVFGMGLALLLQRATRWKRFIRGSVLIPFVAPTALTTLGWWLIFDPTYSHINWALKHIWPLNLLGLGPYQWLGQEYLALAAVLSSTSGAACRFLR